MGTNDTNGKIIYKDLSYEINGLLFKVHNALGRYAREKQYGDALETLLQENKIKYVREGEIKLPYVKTKNTNVADFIIESKILVELKAKPIVTRGDYDQIQRYLQASNYKLGLLVNFRNLYLKPIRIIRSNS